MKILKQDFKTGPVKVTHHCSLLRVKMFAVLILLTLFDLWPVFFLIMGLGCDPTLFSSQSN